MSRGNGYSGPGERRIVVDPRTAFRTRQQRHLADDDPIQAPPPSLLGDESDNPAYQSSPFRWTPQTLAQTTEQPLPGYLDDEVDPVRETLRLRIRPGRRSDRTARVRVYHRLNGAPEAGLEGRCWAFTITRVAYERLLTERVLDSEQATWPNGTLVVPLGVDPLYVPLRCGSCGTQRVECLQMECWQD